MNKMEDLEIVSNYSNIASATVNNAFRAIRMFWSDPVFYGQSVKCELKGQPYE